MIKRMLVIGCIVIAVLILAWIAFGQYGHRERYGIQVYLDNQLPNVVSVHLSCDPQGFLLPPGELMSGVFCKGHRGFGPRDTVDLTLTRGQRTLFEAPVELFALSAGAVRRGFSHMIEVGDDGQIGLRNFP